MLYHETWEAVSLDIETFYSKLGNNNNRRMRNGKTKTNKINTM